MSFWEMSITGGIMVCVIALIRAVLLNRLPKKVFVFLWEIAMLRFVLPLSVRCVTSIYTLFQSNIQLTATDYSQLSNSQNANRFQWLSELGIGNISFVSILSLLWLIGFAVVFSYFLIGYISVYRKYRYSIIYKNEFADDWLSVHKHKRSVKLCLSSYATAPLTYGIIHPVIILPKSVDNISSEQLVYILTHEYVHIKRVDMIRKMIMCIVASMHWFNPAVWILFALYNRDIEFACDEKVVEMNGYDCRSEYAMALIGMKEKQKELPCLFSNFSNDAIEKRIVAIMKTAKISVTTVIASMAVIIGVTCVFATSAKLNNNNADNDVLYISDKNEVLASENEDNYYYTDDKMTVVMVSDDCFEIAE